MLLQRSKRTLWKTTTKIDDRCGAKRAAMMLRGDLESSGIAYQDKFGRAFDFHSLRHQFISNLAESGVHPKIAQNLARYSTVTLTMDRYAHSRDENIKDALDQLPSIVPSDQPEKFTLLFTQQSGFLYPEVSSSDAELAGSSSQTKASNSNESTQLLG